MFDLIIIGGGPAGITAGIYASRKKIKTLLITKEFIGQVGNSFVIENYPGFSEVQGIELIQKLKKHVEKFDIEIKQGEKFLDFNKDKDIFKVETDKGEYSSKSVILAVGREPRQLNIPGEKEYMGKGVTWCTTCDGPLFEGKDVVIIGGGNSGFESALELSRYCPKVYILEVSSELKADEVLQEKVKAKENIEIIFKARAREIKGDKMVTSLIYQDLDSDTEKEINVEGIFIQVGYSAATKCVQEFLDCNKRGEIIVEPWSCKTKTPGLFAAGDITSIPTKQIITAAAQGCEAALSVYKYLNE